MEITQFYHYEKGSVLVLSATEKARASAEKEGAGWGMEK